jgi:hypothetical protein
MLSDFRKSIAFGKVPRLSPFTILLRAMCRWRWVWSTGGMILTGEIKSTQRKTCPSATLSTTYLTWKGLGSNPSVRV